MSFRDDDLKRLKGKVKRKFFISNTIVGIEEIEALIARLEVAEKVIKMWVITDEDSTLKNDKHIKAWLVSKGKGE